MNQAFPDADRLLLTRVMKVTEQALRRLSSEQCQARVPLTFFFFLAEPELASHLHKPGFNCLVSDYHVNHGRFLILSPVGRLISATMPNNRHFDAMQLIVLIIQTRATLNPPSGLECG